MDSEVLVLSFSHGMGADRFDIHLLLRRQRKSGETSISSRVTVTPVTMPATPAGPPILQ